MPRAAKPRPKPFSRRRRERAARGFTSDFDLRSPSAAGRSQLQVSQQDNFADVLRATSGACVGVAADL